LIKLGLLVRYKISDTVVLYKLQAFCNVKINWTNKNIDHKHSLWTVTIIMKTAHVCLIIFTSVFFKPFNLVDMTIRPAALLFQDDKCQIPRNSINFKYHGYLIYILLTKQNSNGHVYLKNDKYMYTKKSTITP
jgi:amino acid transporter